MDLVLHDLLLISVIDSSSMGSRSQSRQRVQNWILGFGNTNSGELGLGGIEEQLVRGEQSYFYSRIMPEFVDGDGTIELSSIRLLFQFRKA